MIRLMTVLSVALFLAGCSSSTHTPNDAHSPAPTSAKQLSGDEIQQVLIGRKLQSRTEKGAVAGAECNTVIELKLEHHAA